MQKIKVKRVYDAPVKDDGIRVLVDRLWPRGLSKNDLLAKDDGIRGLVDRLWPRGLSKNDANIYAWAKEIAPSNALRRWYKHDPHKWLDFKKKYFAELNLNAENVEKFLHAISKGTATFVYGSKEEKLNNAAALKEYIDAR